jgi:phosphatidylglycerophosphate synthase
MAPRPSLAEVRAVGQPDGLFDRSEESWSGRMYLRRVSPHLTRLLAPTRVDPDAVTWAMIVAGILAAAALSVPGVLTAIVAVLLIQLQILFDCVDGELARWRRHSGTPRAPSAKGVYIDHIGHLVTETLLPIALGIRADGGWESLGTYTTLGLVVAVLALSVRAMGSLVHAVRAEAGLAALPDHAERAAPPASLLARARRAAVRLPFYRAFIAFEFTLLALAAAVVDAFDGDQLGSRVLVIALIPAAALTVAGRLAAILASDRLR